MFQRLLVAVETVKTIFVGSNPNASLAVLTGTDDTGITYYIART